MERLDNLTTVEIQVLAGGSGLILFFLTLAVVMMFRAKSLAKELEKTKADAEANATAAAADAASKAEAAKTAADAAASAATLAACQLAEARTLTQSAVERRQEIETKYSVILSAEDEAKRLTDAAKASVDEMKTNAEEQVALLNQTASKLANDIDVLRTSYKEKKVLFDKLAEQMALYDERLAFAELGVYEPHFEFSDSEAYKQRIGVIRERQKEMVSAKTAVSTNTTWTVEGSVSKGQTMINRQTRLTMRAFNNECEAAIANVRWNNINARKSGSMHLRSLSTIPTRP